jgi:hypothetical protein
MQQIFRPYIGAPDEIGTRHFPSKMQATPYQITSYSSIFIQEQVSHIRSGTKQHHQQITRMLEKTQNKDFETKILCPETSYFEAM